jgi:hypothetical protein
MLKSVLKLAPTCAFLIFTACSVNLFTEFANQSSDEALLVDARQKIDNRDYVNALKNFPLMSTTYQTRRDVIALQASAYAGEAGLDFLNLASNLQSIGTTNLMIFLMQNFEHGSAATMLSLKTAQNLMLSISSSTAGLTNDENLELAVIALANMGTILSATVDTDSNGTVDAGVNPCLTTPIQEAAAPNDNIQEFGVSLNWVLAAVTQLSNNGVNFGPSTVTEATAACLALSGAGLGAYSFCNVTNPTSFTPAQILGLRSLLNEGSAHVGLGTCVGDILACHC